MVKGMAIRAGFARVGIAPGEPLPAQAADAYRAFLRQGLHAGIRYLERHIDKRFAPRELFAEVRSVICLAVSYAPAGPPPEAMPFVARYARGQDYHRVLRDRCRGLIDGIRREVPGFAGRVFVDAGPIAERSLAARAGVGWVGRNGCLIVPGLGSYVVLAEILCNLPLVADRPLPASCGDCTACVDNCPTGASRGDGLVDGRRCLSYLSIEHRGEVPSPLRDLWGRRLFGCDSCQEVCPYNREAPPGDSRLTGRGPPLEGASLRRILTWDRPEWDAATKNSAIRRVGYEGLMRNTALAAGHSRDPRLVEPLARLRERLPGMADTIDWARRRLRESGQPANPGD